MKRYLSIIYLLAISTVATAQTHTRTISGQVLSNEEKTPLSGVVVYVKGTKNVSGSQEDGMYYIEVGSRDSVLVFSLDGYGTKEVPLTSDNYYNVSLNKGNASYASMLFFRQADGCGSDIQIRQLIAAKSAERDPGYR